MTQDDIHSCHPWCERPACVRQRVFEMAREALVEKEIDLRKVGWLPDYLERFAALVVAHERARGSTETAA